VINGNQNICTSAKRNKSRTRRAFTLVELIVSLVIMAILSVAVCAMTFGAMNVDRFSRSTSSAQSEIELAMRRIANNLRTAQTGSITVGTNTCSSLTQADSTNSYPNGATVTYTLAADPNATGQQMLVETDQRFGTNTLLHNVTTFTVAAVSGIGGLYQVDLVVGSSMVEERHFKVFTRN